MDGSVAVKNEEKDEEEAPRGLIAFTTVCSPPALPHEP